MARKANFYENKNSSDFSYNQPLKDIFNLSSRISRLSVLFKNKIFRITGSISRENIRLKNNSVICLSKNLQNL